MTDVPAENYAQAWAADVRSEPPLVGDERETLTAFLDWHRATFELKCSGVPAQRLSDRDVPPSRLSLHGLLRHLAAVERWWFRQQFAGEDIAHLYYSDEDPDQDFEALDGDVAEALAAWRTECERAR
ncbi:MAG: DinB family protein, partial [Candidatus Dormibacteraeota bacterium]|nr:DinB family protein [Candidatus Dormibacteraeota bacterium]